MDWLKQNVFVATWIGLMVAIIGLFLRAPRNKVGAVDWPRTLLYFSVVATFAVAVTPQFDADTRQFARFVFIFALTGAWVDRRQQM